MTLPKHNELWTRRVLGRVHYRLLDECTSCAESYSKTLSFDRKYKSTEKSGLGSEVRRYFNIDLDFLGMFESASATEVNI